MAMIMCMIMVVASMCMITSATVFSAEEKADTVTDEISESKVETEESSTTVETTVATSVTTEEATTTTAETTSLEDVGAAIREELGIKIKDVVYFNEVVELKDSKGKSKETEANELIWLVGIDDLNQCFRVYVPRLNTVLSTKIYYLNYNNCSEAKLKLDEDGMVIGDIDFNGRINAKDLTLMKRGMIFGWNGSESYLMADMDADGFVSVADLVLIQKWLLGGKA